MIVQLADIDPVKVVGRLLSVEGVLLGQGNFVDGGTCWIVPSWEQRDDPTTRVELRPQSFFIDILKNVDLYGGGEYVIYYPATVEGVMAFRESKPVIDVVSVEIVTQVKVVNLTSR